MSQNRKSKNRSLLNAIRITLLDWDPMDLFLSGQAGLEEYDVYIADISDAIKKSKSKEELYDFLKSICEEKMEVKIDVERMTIAAEKFLGLDLG